MCPPVVSTTAPSSTVHVVTSTTAAGPQSNNNAVSVSTVPSSGTLTSTVKTSDAIAKPTETNCNLADTKTSGEIKTELPDTSEGHDNGQKLSNIEISINETIKSENNRSDELIVPKIEPPSNDTS